MTAEFVSVVAGILLSVGFTYIPKLNESYAGLDSTKKSLIMLGLMALVAGGAYGLSCSNWWEFGVTCDKAGAQQVISAFIAAVVGNQVAYRISPEPQAVKDAKAAR